MDFIFNAFVGVIIAVSSFLGIYHEPQVEPAPIELGSSNYVSSGTYKLAGGGISSSDTSIIVDAFVKPISGQIYSMSEFGTTGYVTLEPGSATKKEFASFTGLSYSGTRATLTGVTRGLEFNTPYTASSSLRLSHAGGTGVIISNPPQLYNNLATKANTETISGIWTFSATPQITNNAINPLDAVNRQTLLATAISGAGTSTEAAMGIVRLATNAQVGTAVASSTTGQPLVIANKFASTTYNPATVFQGLIPALRSTFNIDPMFIATSSLSVYNWAGLHTFSATTTFATSTIASTTIANLNVTNPFIVNAITGTSTIAANLRIANNASTTNIFVSGTCNHCVVPTIVSASSGACSTVSGSSCTVTATCAAGMIATGGGGRSGGDPSSTNPLDNYPSAANAWTFATYMGSTGAAHTVTAYVMCVPQ